MIKVASIGKFAIIKDGTSYYRVMRGRKRIGSFLSLSEATEYMDKRHEIETGVAK